MLQQRRRERKPNKPGLGVAGILLIAIGLVGKLCTANGATTVHRRNAALGKSTSTPAQLYFDAIAPEDRENFIKYHLDKALEGRLPHHTSSIPRDFEFVTFQDALEPENFSTNLLDHFMIAYGLSEVDVYAFVVLNLICFPSGWCFNPDDVGNICCPF